MEEKFQSLDPQSCLNLNLLRNTGSEAKHRVGLGSRWLDGSELLLSKTFRPLVALRMGYGSHPRCSPHMLLTGVCVQSRSKKSNGCTGTNVTL